jgi:flavorubredoxin
MNKKLFIYYSETGNGDLVAEHYKNKNYDIEKIISKKLPKTLFFQMMVGGFRATASIKPKINELTKDINNYDEIIIGSPIWNDRLCAPIRTLLSKYDFTNKKVNFVLYSGGGSANTATEFINTNYPDAKVVVLRQPKENLNQIEKELL